MEPQTPGERPYPVSFAVEYPDRDLNRLSTFFRIFAAIPILIVARPVGGGDQLDTGGEHERRSRVGGTGGCSSCRRC